MLYSDASGLFSYVEVGSAMGVQGLLGGAISKAMGGSFTAGLIGGMLGGAAGGLVNTAFASTAGSWLASLSTHALVGGVDGAVSGFATTLLEGKGWRAALADGAAGFFLGAATGGIVDRAGRSHIFAGLLGRALPFGIDPKIARQMAPRGWSQELIAKTIRDPKYVRASSTNQGAPATAFFLSRNQYVVRRDIDGMIVQVSDQHKSGWIVDKHIIDPP